MIGPYFIVDKTPEYFDNVKFAKALGLAMGDFWQEGKNTVYPSSIGVQDLSLYTNDLELDEKYKDLGCSDTEVIAALMEASNDKKVQELKKKRDEVVAAKNDKKD